jgi:hypothetical protein
MFRLLNNQVFKPWAFTTTVFKSTIHSGELEV